MMTDIGEDDVGIDGLVTVRSYADNTAQNNCISFVHKIIKSTATDDGDTTRS